MAYFQEYEDFSFNLSYNLNDIKNNIIIYYNKIKEIDLFQYLIYKETNILYNNKTIYEYSKEFILNNILNEMKKNLIYYPESDSLYNFRMIYEYFLNKEFGIFVYCEHSFYYRGKITFFSYEEIIKVNTTVILKNLDIILMYKESSDYDKYDKDEFEKPKLLELDKIQLEPNFEIIYPNLNEYEYSYCLLEELKYIVKKTIYLLD